MRPVPAGAWEVVAGRLLAYHIFVISRKIHILFVEVDKVVDTVVTTRVVVVTGVVTDLLELVA